ncbi:TerC family protein [Pseudomonas sp. Marseille-QA0892]
MLELISTPEFWIGVAQIIAIDLLLGGDNAVVIALACRRLPEHQRNRAIIIGALGAIVLRLALIFFALELLSLPYLRLVGAALLLWIGIKLMRNDGGNDDENLTASAHLWGAVRTIIVADAVMSLDNVIAIAAASQGQMVLVAIGIIISIPLIVWGSKLVLWLMDRFPIIITIGAALLGWIAGDMATNDLALPTLPEWAHYASGALGAAVVLAIGAGLNALQRRRARRRAA